MAGYTRISLRPVTGALGAEISGVWAAPLDLAQIDDETFGEITRAWLDHLVIFFRDQKFSSDQQITFAKRFGDIHYHPYMMGMDEHPEILEILNKETDTKAFGPTWHTDQMFNPKPAKATILYAEETPQTGGDTLFANGYLANQRLSEPMKRVCDGLKTWNVGDRNKLNASDQNGAGSNERYKGNQKMAAKVRQPPEDLVTEAAHRLVRTHPETGHKALYVGNHSVSLAGFEQLEARPILDYLKAHSTRPEMTCRFRWQPGSMAIWGNRCTQHHAVNDYPRQRRRMLRITIAGDQLF